MKTLLLVLSLGILIVQPIFAQAPATPPPPLKLGQLMRPEQIKDMGLDKLSDRKSVV